MQQFSVSEEPLLAAQVLEIPFQLEAGVLHASIDDQHTL